METGFGGHRRARLRPETIIVTTDRRLYDTVTLADGDSRSVPERIGSTATIQWASRRLAPKSVRTGIWLVFLGGIGVYLMFVFEGRARYSNIDDPLAVYLGLGWLVPQPRLVGYTLIVGGLALAVFRFVVLEFAYRGRESAEDTSSGR